MLPLRQPGVEGDAVDSATAVRMALQDEDFGGQAALAGVDVEALRHSRVAAGRRTPLLSAALAQLFAVLGHQREVSLPVEVLLKGGLVEQPQVARGHALGPRHAFLILELDTTNRDALLEGSEVLLQKPYLSVLGPLALDDLASWQAALVLARRLRPPAQLGQVHAVGPLQADGHHGNDADCLPVLLLQHLNLLRLVRLILRLPPLRLRVRRGQLLDQLQPLEPAHFDRGGA
mmetsp:Transcript_27149/g.68926  ORF Transcript_27149/g.68926 Transcript_27149/m.68926 type:complete len:232 (+) Transcript_27149:204-899(+)